MLRDPFCAPISPAGAAAPCPTVPSPAAPQRIRLVHVFVDGGHPHARVEVGPTSTVVHVDEPFGGSYRVVRLADGCADILDGDAPFRLCVGQEVVR
jgi:hypothetical protein